MVQNSLRKVHRLAVLTSLVSWVLVWAGSLVTSTGSGLSVPDWPLSYGKFFPPMVGGVRFEHTHRMIAGAVVLLTLGLAHQIRKHERRRLVRALALAAVTIIIVQALLGGLTVLWMLPKAISALHAATAQIFFTLTVLIAVLTSPAWFQHLAEPAGQPFELPRAKPPLAKLVVFLIMAGLAQLMLGALVRHGITNVLPHMGGALLLGVLIVRLLNRTNEYFSDISFFYTPVILAGLLFTLQILLGILAYAARLAYQENEFFSTAGAVLSRSSHVALGALLLADLAVVGLIALSWRTPKTPPKTAYLPDKLASPKNACARR